MTTLLLAINWQGACITLIIMAVIASYVGSIGGHSKATKESLLNPKTLSLNDAGKFFKIEDIDGDKVLLQVGISSIDGPEPESLWYSIKEIPKSIRENSLWFKVVNDDGKLGFSRCKLENHALQPYGNVLSQA